MAQYEFNNFPDTQRPGMYVVSSGGGGSQHFVESSQLSSTDYRFIVMLFDPFTRTVAAYCATHGIFEGDGDENPCRDVRNSTDFSDLESLFFSTRMSVLKGLLIWPAGLMSSWLCLQAASYVDSLETPSDLISFINNAPSEYLLVVQTHHW